MQAGGVNFQGYQDGGEELPGVAVGMMDAYQPGGAEGIVWEEQYSKDPEGGWVWGNHRDTTPEQREEMRSMVRQHKAAFAYSMAELPGYEHLVNIGEYRGKPAYSRPKQYSPVEDGIIHGKCEELRDAAMIRQLPLDSPHASRPTIAAKKDAQTGEWTDHRFCINYVRQNQGTATIPHGLPLPSAIFRGFGSARYFSKLDMRSGFHQLKLDEQSQQRTAFWWKGELWCYTVLPFGLKNSSAIYQRVMDTVLGEAGLAGFAAAFIDDVVVWSDTPEEHVQRVRAVLEALQAAGLRAHPDKSIFMAEGVEYLGHVVSPRGLTPHQARVAAFKQLQQPRTKEELKSQLGMLGFYRCYLPHYSSIADPLRRFLKQDSPSLLEWDEESSGAWEGLIGGLTQEGLCLRREDPSRPFVLHTDWSTRGLGAVLSQVDEYGQEGIVACLSRSLNQHEARYTPWKGELLGVVWAMKMFKPYLAGRDFTVVTDHRPLLWLMTTVELTGQQERWVLSLQEFSFSVQHRAGKLNPADLPSRYPITSAADPTAARLDEEGAVQQKLPRVGFATEEQRQQAIQEFIEGTYVLEHGIAAALSRVPDLPTYQPEEDRAAAHYQLLQQLYAAVPAVAAAVTTHVMSGVDLELDEGELPEASSSSQAQLQQDKLSAWARQHVAGVGFTGEAGKGELGCAGFYQGMGTGVTLVELFGGMCAGLEATLRNGVTVSRYVYVDTNPEVRRVAQHRLSRLLAAYPQQFTVEACKGAFSFWPQDIRQLQQQQVQQLVQLGGSCLVWAGWECQDLSAAGSGKGLMGARSSTFFPLYRLLRQLKEGLGDKVAWVLENTAVDVPWQRSGAALADAAVLKQLLGEPLVLDAAQYGSRAHRLRYYWTNLAPRQLLGAAMEAVQRPAGRLVQQVMQPGRVCQPVRRDDNTPFYRCNRVGQPRQAWPTLMATVASYSFRQGGDGVVWDGNTGTWGEPSVEERERALGYVEGDTAAPGVSALVRHQVTGRCMDANTVMALVAVAGALVERHWGLGCCRAAAAVEGVERESEGCLTGGYAQFLQLQAAAAVANQQEAVQPGSKDIWEDAAALEFLQVGQHQQGASRQQKSRITHRARLYQWSQGQLWRRMPDRSLKCVPKPQDRQGVIQGIHERAGHFGVRRTAALVLLGHWWRTLHEDVAAFVRGCVVCDRARAGFDGQQAQLTPLPIEPMFYRWGVDLAGDFPVTARGYKYVFIAVEHFSKHVELVPLRDKTPAETAAAMTEVLCRFAAPAEVITDGGGEFEDQFDQLLQACFVDHRLTSAHHPQANGMAERVVQVVKRGLRKLCESKVTQQWDLQLPWVALGYRCSKQSSTGFSPYELLYGRQPIFPSAVQPKMEEPIDLHSQDAAASSILERAEWLRERIPVAAANLRAAQHRDQLRYQQLRSKGYVPKVTVFQPGDFVYLRRPKVGSSLQIKARAVIFKVLRVAPDGVVRLQDRAGREFKYQVGQLALCHLPDLDGAVDPLLQGEDQAAQCEGCGSAGDEAVFMFCDACNLGWHTYCCAPPLSAVPEGLFICDRCRGKGVAADQLQLREVQRQWVRDQGEVPDLFPLADKRRRDERAAALHGRLLRRTTGHRVQWGRVNYLGALARPRYFKVVYHDGEPEEGLTYFMVTKGRGYALVDEGVVPPPGVQVPAAELVPVV
jgi:site-specific DNA-cytosine methylase